MKKKRLIIHIGVHKTGSTSAQQTLFDNASQLKSHGILYPKFYAGSNTVPHHQALAWEAIEGQIDPVKLRAWAESLAATDAHTVILSAEDFSKCLNLDFVKCFTDLFKTEVIVYLRRQDKWITSWYNQHIKWPFHERFARCTPTEFLGYLHEFHWINYFDMLGLWEKAIGKDRLHIKVMERGQIQDPVADLIDFCGVDFELEKPPKRENESLPAAQLKILRDLGGLLQYSPDVRYRVQKAVTEVPTPSGTEVYPKAVLSMILDRYRPGNELVAERYLGRKDRTLFYDVEVADTPTQFVIDQEGEQLYCFARNLIQEFRVRAARRRALRGPPTAVESSSAKTQDI